MFADNGAIAAHKCGRGGSGGGGNGVRVAAAVQNVVATFQHI